MREWTELKFCGVRSNYLEHPVLSMCVCISSLHLHACMDVIQPSSQPWMATVGMTTTYSGHSRHACTEAWPGDLPATRQPGLGICPPSWTSTCLLPARLGARKCPPVTCSSSAVSTTTAPPIPNNGQRTLLCFELELVSEQSSSLTVFYFQVIGEPKAVAVREGM